jgi:polyisoprenoid-binding protein YceI
MIRPYLLAGAALTALAALPLAGAAEAADTYKLDPVHSNIIFATDHMGFAKMVGQFQEFEGSFTFDGNSVEGVTVEVAVKTASIDTDHEARDKHLSSPDFFNVQEFPEMTFKSTGVEPTGDKAAKLTGDLTLLGVTKPITLEVTFNKADANPMDPNVFIAGFSAKGTLKRSDFGMQYGQGAIGDEVMLWIEAEGLKQ